MKSLVRQLSYWRLLEQVLQIVRGGSHWLAIVATILALACWVDWLYDRRVDVPFILRLLASTVQFVIALALALVLVIRPLLRMSSLDSLAFRAERAIPELGHRLVTALQLNRVGARTQGMSRSLIADVTREANEMASRHRFTKLTNYRPAGIALAVMAPVILSWGVFAAWDSHLATVLLKRQFLMGGEIPRSVQISNETEGLWPTGSEVVIRYRVTGKWNPAMVGEVKVSPNDQPTDYYPLQFERENDDASASFTAKLPPSSIPFSFSAHLGDGRSTSIGRVDFEPPPQVSDIDAWLLLPSYLGGRSAQLDGKPITVPFERHQSKGEVVNVLPESSIRVEAKFNKPVVKAFLIPITRGEGNKEVDGESKESKDIEADGQSAEWTFTPTAKTIAYRIELVDARGFKSPTPTRRGVRMYPDEPPLVEFRKESNRNPDPEAFDGKGDPRIYEWDFPTSWRQTGGPGEGETGPIQVIYSAHSELGISRANVAYRVIARGEDGGPNVHPRDDPDGRIFARSTLLKTELDVKKLGRFVPELGLFEKSFVGLNRLDRFKVSVGFYPIPSSSPDVEPGELDAGGRYNFLTSGLRKPGSNGTFAKLEVGDIVELYVEVFDKYAAVLQDRKLPTRVAGYTREAKRKVIVSEQDALLIIRQRDESQRKLQDKLRELSDDQRSIFQPKK